MISENELPPSGYIITIGYYDEFPDILPEEYVSARLKEPHTDNQIAEHYAEQFGVPVERIHIQGEGGMFGDSTRVVFLRPEVGVTEDGVVVAHALDE